MAKRWFRCPRGPLFPTILFIIALIIVLVRTLVQLGGFNLLSWLGVVLYLVIALALWQEDMAARNLAIVVLGGLFLRNLYAAFQVNAIIYNWFVALASLYFCVRLYLWSPEESGS